MAVTILNALFLTECWREGVRFDSTLTLGRLDCFMWSRDLERIARLLPGDSKFVESVRRREVPVRMDNLFAAMGAKRVDAMDASDFEGAAILQDLNEPLAAPLRSKYDAVVDTGTIEHVFNVPMACRNVMDALKVGGHFLAALPANNYCGHGFYQFSAEFFYRVFSAENGFEMQKLYVAPAYVAGKWLDGPAFEVADPKEMRGRVEIEGRRKMLFLVQARKIGQESVFAKWPQQSDYEVAWSQVLADKYQHVDKLRMLRSAANAFKKMICRIKGVGRLSERIKERRIWTRRCLRNPALRPHKWVE
jgi:SAM-dependent methyltransferase